MTAVTSNDLKAESPLSIFLRERGIDPLAPKAGDEVLRFMNDAERMVKAANEDLSRAVKERDEALQQVFELRIRCTALEDALCPERLRH